MDQTITKLESLGTKMQELLLFRWMGINAKPLRKVEYPKRGNLSPTATLKTQWRIYLDEYFIVLW
jgi:hypothetical protein